MQLIIIIITISAAVLLLHSIICIILDHFDFLLNYFISLIDI